MKNKTINHFFRSHCLAQFRRVSVLAITCFIGEANLQAQNYHYRYSHGSGISNYQPQGKSIVIDNAQCGVATCNSILMDNGTSDFQLMFVTPNGSFTSAYKFGTSEGNEICNGLCKSINYSNQYILCGQSTNHKFLVIKVDNTGAVLWSKEITFSYENSEAITVFPVQAGNLVDEGYIVVGNSNSTTGINSVAVAKFKENGVLAWSAEYNIGTKILATDAMPRKSTNERIFSVVGFREYSGIFLMNIFSGNGNLYNTQGANYRLQPSVALFNPQLTEIFNASEENIAITFQRDASSSNSVAHYAFKTEGLTLYAPIWGRRYYRSGQHGYMNSDLFTMSNGKLSALGSYSTFDGINTKANPYVLRFDPSGNITSYRDYNVGGYEMGASLIESCGSAYEVFTSFVISQGAINQRIIKKSIATEPDCSSSVSWQQANEEVVKELNNITKLVAGTSADYEVTGEALSAVKYDCFNNEVNRLGYTTNISEGRQEREQWFYPNPAQEKIHLQLGEQPEKVTLYEITGKVIYSAQLSGEASIDLNGISTGVYFLEKSDVNGSLERQKVIIR